MIKHRGFPGRLPGTDFQFTIRRANPRGVTPLTRRERHADRRPADKRADAGFLQAQRCGFIEVRNHHAACLDSTVLCSDGVADSTEHLATVNLHLLQR